MKLSSKLNLFLLSSLSLTIFACSSGSTAITSRNLNTTATDIPSYQFVIDAGSSGSRIYVYSKSKSESQIIVTDLYEQKTNNPLASFSVDPSKAGTSLMSLIKGASQYLKGVDSTVDLEFVPISVLGTAGMRLIPESQQSQIYANVAESITNAGLMAGQTKTITGQDEGVYSWLDVNYLQNNLFSNHETSGVFEVGGASAQVAFATTELNSNKSNIKTITLNGRSYKIFSLSLLGLGQDYARGMINSNLDNNSKCYPQGYSYSGINFPYFDNSLIINGDFNYYQCMDNYSFVVNHFPEINIVNQISGFDSQQFIGIGSVYFALNFWEIEQYPELLTSKIQTTCYQDYEQMQSQYPKAYNLQNQCANAVLINDMLVNNLKFAPGQLHAVPSINGTNLSYTLGFALLNS